MGEVAVSTATDLGELEQYRSQLTSYCYRMLGSPFDAEDAVQDALVRAWRSRDRFEGRSALRSWLYRIATNVCLDMIKSRQRRIRPMALGPAQEPIEKESIRLALVAAMQHLPAKQRAVLILREVLRLEASEVAQLLDTTVQSVNSALQRARATLAKSNVSMTDPAPRLNDSDRVMLERYVSAFERYDLSALTALIREDATQSMPPYDMWLSGRDDIMTWWFGPGIGCKGSRVLAAISANGMPTFGQYKIDPNGGYAPWALQVLDLKDGKIADITFFLGTERLFPLFGLPLHLDS